MDLFWEYVIFNRALKVLIITNGLVLVAGAMLGPIYALFVEDMGGSLLEASITGGIFSLAAGLTTFLAGRYSDRVRHESLIVSFAYLMMGIGFMLYLFVNSFIFLLFVQVIIGFSEALYVPAFDSLYTRHVSRSKAGRQWGVYEAMNYLTTALGAMLGGVLVTLTGGFSAIFISMGILCFLSSAYLYHLPRKVL
ncbi:MFS transporter [Candidatus Woesearchaeota archaeon]|nr:MFS transporter [Candidatus Woesearchaeota archaeon]